MHRKIKVVKKFNKYDQRGSVMSLVWYMRLSFWNFGICIEFLVWY